VPSRHGDPGPLHVSLPPSPVDHTTLVGFAVAVTVRPGTDAVALRAPHDEESSQNQVGTNTNWAAGGVGFTRIAGGGSCSRRNASCTN
jgi:hypothetical protein